MAATLPWPPDVDVDGVAYMIRPSMSDARLKVPDRVFIFGEDGLPVLTVRRRWASYEEAVRAAELALRDHLLPHPIDVFGAHGSSDHLASA